jgi:hypothetical protein
MKISGETKVGALTAVAITLLVLGFNFLKGKNLSTKDTKLYAVFTDVKGLSNSNPVIVNGKQVGTVYATQFSKVFHSKKFSSGYQLLAVGHYEPGHQIGQFRNLP